MSDGKLSFSFGAKPAAKGAAAPAPSTSGMSNMELLMAKAKAASKPKPKQPVASLFADDDDEAPRAAPSLAGPSRKKVDTAPAGPRPNLLSRAERRAQEEALKVDQSVFDYDGVYDGMKAAEREAVEVKKATEADKKPKYIESFLQSAQTRRLDRLRAEEKMLALEREREGDEFADKEKFVTEAYKKQMEEVRLAEEEERVREDALRNSKKGPGLTSLYKSMLDSDEAKHAAAVAATSKPTIGPSLAIKPPTQPQYDDEEEYDPSLAREAKLAKLRAGASLLSEETGKHIDVNDEGEIVDKRSLLKKGLNIIKKPQPAPLPESLLSGSRSAAAEQDKPYVSRAVGSSASYGERMARERARLAAQVKEEEAKKRADAERRAREEEEAARKRREGDDGEAARRREEAKARFLERKRAREEEAEKKKRQKTE